MDIARGGPFGSDKFSKDVRFVDDGGSVHSHTLHSGLIGGSMTSTMTTKDPNDHLKTNHSQLEVFRPCYLQDGLYSPRPAPGPQSPGHMCNTQSETSLLFSGPQEGFSCHIL